MNEYMVELTVVFGNESIPNKVLLTGPFDIPPAGHTADISRAIDDLRTTAESELGSPLEDGQCFYRIFRR